MHHLRPAFSLGLLVTTVAPLAPACAENAAPDAIAVSGRYVGDVVHVDEGSADARTFLLHEAEAALDIDFEQLAGAPGLSAGFQLLATAGDRPNDAAGTLQGINNIEVERHRVKLYQAWLEQGFAGGRASLRLGLTDLNADFYQNDSAGLLLGPAFGIGSELASTGPNGPSIFPSTALTARLSLQLGEDAYGRFAVVNAKSGVLGEPDGIDFSMRDGALLIGELGITAGGKLALGVWGYTEPQDDINRTEPDGAPRKRTAAGVYLLAERRLAGTDARGVDAFLRVGRSDGVTTPFRGGFQAGLLMTGPFAGRPEGQVSFGIQQGQLSSGFRQLLHDEQGLHAAPSEWGVELTYSDKLASFLSVQPDVQFIRRSFADGGERSTFVLTFRSTLAFGGS